MIDDQTALAKHCQTLKQLTDTALTWIDDNIERVGNEHESMGKELRRAGRLFAGCQKAATRKMCVSVFGPSQSGKSYLISALARDPSGKLMAQFADIYKDFISEINPEGGKESTGLVTRFTMTQKADCPAGFPVQLRLLSESDLVKIIANTYYADCEHKAVPDAKLIKELLDVLEKCPKVTSQNLGNPSATLNAFEDLRDYLHSDFQAKPRVQELERSYWARACALGPHLSTSDRIRLYSLIWDGVEPFTTLLTTLVLASEQLGYPDQAFASLDALIPRAESIIDVATLEDLVGQEASSTPLTLCTQNGVQATLPRAIVTALTAELTIVMQNKPDTYFDHTDLLDFPGYRSRYKIADISYEITKPSMLKQLFLRGKVAYLFQRYCAERELTSMALCIGPSNQEVQDLPAVINNWIVSTHGESAAQRLNKPVALYFILSKFDMEFEQKSGAPSVETRWDNRLQASLLNFFGKQHDWPTIWDGQKAFNNLFLLRNPNFRFDAIMEYDDAGNEKGIRPDKVGYVESLEKAFMESSLVASHFQNPRESWDAAMKLDDGGIGLLREKLRPLCNPDIKTQQLRISLQERCHQLQQRLKPFHQSDDKDILRQEKRELSKNLAKSFARMAEQQRFGEFLYALTVRDYELYDLYFEAERRRECDAQENGSSLSTQPTTRVGKSVNADDILDDLFGDDPIESSASEQNADEVARPRDQAQYFAALIESYWFNHLHELAQTTAIQKHFGLDAQRFADFVAELSMASKRLALRQEMEDHLREAAQYANISTDRLIWKQVSIAASLINTFIAWLGYNPQNTSAEQRTIRGGKQDIIIFVPPAIITGLPVLGSQAEQERLERTRYTDWLRALIANITANVDFDGESIIDQEQNSRLGALLLTLQHKDD